MHRNFHPWEGGEGRVPTQHITARIGLAQQLMETGNPQAALEHLQKAKIYFPNFGEGKLTGAQENNIEYYMGVVQRALGNGTAAKASFEKASSGLSKPTSAMYYNDQPPHMIFYQGLVLIALGRETAARSRFHKLVDYGEKHVFEPQVMDYFAISMPDFMVFETDLDEKNQTHCYYMMGLGYLGLGEKQKAKCKGSLCKSPDHDPQPLRRDRSPEDGLTFNCAQKFMCKRSSTRQGRDMRKPTNRGSRSGCSLIHFPIAAIPARTGWRYARRIRIGVHGGSLAAQT